MKNFCKLLLVLFLLPLSLSAYSLQRVSVHDPSIVWEPNSRTYYIFGSHRAAAKTTDMMNWTAFVAPWQTASSNNAANNAAFTTPVVRKVKKGGVEVELPAFNAYDWAGAYPDWRDGNGNAWNINDNMWAPDVIWNKSMNKWCMYLTVNGPYWNSCIILLTADQIEGPYRYQAPVVISGFFNTNNNNVNYKKTDLELVLGKQNSLPSRYAMKLSGSGNWGERWPNNIDACVFYDEDGKLWMTYGSWSGGIWMLELDEKTGLRDYDVNYELTGSGNDITVDPYFGKKIAGGYYVSGEASYIEHIGNHYFLFVTNGGLFANGGYQMRVFRSEKPDGPYVDANGVSAIYSKYVMNYGPKSDNRGMNIFGAYGDWGNMTIGNESERAQGHNSIIAAEDDRTYLVYHTRFQNKYEVHEVRVHQVFQNEDGWLVAAPFEYTGEQVRNSDIATTQQVATNKIAGEYKLLIHKYGLDHTKKELAKPTDIKLNADGSISGAMAGKWSIKEGTSYITINIGGGVYKGVMIEQTLEPGQTKAPSFTAMANNGVSIWGYRSGDITSAVPTGNWKYTQDFSSTNGLTIVGGGRIVEDAAFGHAFQNGGDAVRSHYMLLPNDLFSHSAESKQLTIGFWVNATNAGTPQNYTYAPLFTAYGSSPSNINTWPMIAMQSRGLTQINCNGYCDFGNELSINGKVNIYNQNAREISDESHPFVNNWLEDNQWHYYTIVFTPNSATIYLDGEVKNEWIVDDVSEGQMISGIFTNGADLKYICLGGNQAWDWSDNDAKFLFAKLLVQNKAMTADDIKALMQSDMSNGVLGINNVPSVRYNTNPFDLQGRQLTSPIKNGITIQNGKKYFMK